MRQAFVFENIAVLVFPWNEPMDPPERGARLEVRLLEQRARRWTRYAAERMVVDVPVFRADLFDVVGEPVGNLRSVHFHPLLRRDRTLRSPLAPGDQAGSDRVA